jgi:hypothetical protein
VSKLTAPSSTDLIGTTTERHLAKEAATFGYPRVRMFFTAGQTTFGYLRQAPW